MFKYDQNGKKVRMNFQNTKENYGSSKDDDDNKKKWLYYGLGAVGVIALIILIVYMMKKSKRGRRGEKFGFRFF